MKAVVPLLVALSILATFAVPVGALDAKSFYEQLDRQSGGTN